ncbi:PQ-loop repeat-containing protein 1 [Ceratobasidium sp. AG-Ba]|nr:PQ-loop repeat-containing protein 1 [Ceratobasidium sp. AG-Ba]QRW06640.1 PQ-loop repeat-containing protein 1 [Ceratobasidium sp. AG-Ba]
MFTGSESERLEASNVLGWVSIACWIIVYSPQILENYRLKSGEGLSVAFVVIWLIGDLCNLFGGWLAGLLPTIIILAVYYTICDIILLCQIYYYRWTHPVHPASLILPRAPPNPADPESTPDEHSPLLRDRPPNTSASVKTIEEYAHETLARRILHYVLLFGFVIGTGVAAWAINRWIRPHDGTEPVPPREDEVIEWKSQLLGYASAICYLGSRIPQILKNRETKCEGLSLALFMFTLTGNLTYVLSICVASMSKQHLVANASWLAGSGLTMFFDFFVLFQFYYYRGDRGRLEIPAA